VQADKFRPFPSIAHLHREDCQWLPVDYTRCLPGSRSRLINKGIGMPPAAWACDRRLCTINRLHRYMR